MTQSLLTAFLVLVTLVIIGALAILGTRQFDRTFRESEKGKAQEDEMRQFATRHRIWILFLCVLWMVLSGTALALALRSGGANRYPSILDPAHPWQGLIFWTGSAVLAAFVFLRRLSRLLKKDRVDAKDR